MTYNIRTSTAHETDPANNWENRKEFFVHYVDSFAPDILCVQEAMYFPLIYIQSNLHNASYHYTGFGRDDGVHGGEHTAIFFRTDKYRYLDGDTFWLSDTPAYPSRTWGNKIYRVCTWARFEYISTNAQFCIFSTHFDFSNSFHENASKLIQSKVVELTGGLPTFLMGDFNLYNSSAAFKYLDNYGKKPLQDAYRLAHNNSVLFDYSASNFDVTLKPTHSRIDFIFVSTQITPNSCWIPKDSYGHNQTYSDHYPVLLDCVF
jgi:endonuclease/exonuclease/phosphatase family metal-dependent hydrolase